MWTRDGGPPIGTHIAAEMLWIVDIGGTRCQLGKGIILRGSDSAHARRGTFNYWGVNAFERQDCDGRPLEFACASTCTRT